MLHLIYLLIVLQFAISSDMAFSLNMVIERSGKFMFTYIVVAISILLSSCFCRGSDTIYTGQSLLPNQTIISRQGKFELGFFSPGMSTNFYVGIWYKIVPGLTVVWVANRNNPIPYTFYNNSQLVLNGDLYLIVNLERIRISPMISNASEAVILDTGNLVLRNATDIVWQSFDYPTDTWLPGGHVGFRWFSDMETKLVSWRSLDDPGSGNFSVGIEPNKGSELFMTKADGSQRLWRSGPLQEGTFTSLSDSSNLSRYYNFTYVTSDVNVYVAYNVYNESIMSRIVMDYFGRFTHFLRNEASQEWVVQWVQPSDACKYYAWCGPNGICNSNALPSCGCLPGFVPRDAQSWSLLDFSGGCVRRWLCVGKTEFLKISNIRLPANPKSLDVRSGLCELACVDNCSCNAFAFDNEGSCLLFIGDMLDLEVLRNTGADLYVKSEFEAPPKEGKNKVLIPLAVAVPTAIVVLIFCSCYLRRKLKNKESGEAHQNLLLLDLSLNGPTCNKRSSNNHSHGEEKNNHYELPIFSFSSIVASTNNFSIGNKLGEGGFGPVYKGELLNRQFVAVKRLSRRSGQGLEEFRNETKLIAKLQHKNLVKILGCCIENNEKILVYEYMPNKSLDSFLFEPTNKEQLDWRKRVHIIDDIAQGLLYLHHYSRLKIVHRDLKASNILLDVEMNPKISDFGMARIFGGNVSQANTERIVGTYGYMSPEYAMEGRFSMKSDVFAFGILMLEIISGKKNTGFYGSDHLSLLGYAWNLWKDERTLELIDPVLQIPDSLSSTPLQYIHIGLLCVEENPADRPLMSNVVAMLNNDEKDIALPQHPAFTVGRSSARTGLTLHKAEICSINDMTISNVEAR